MKMLEKYTEKKRLSLSTEKTKILIFERGRGNRKKAKKWKWGAEDMIEEVRVLDTWAIGYRKMVGLKST